MLCGLAGHRPGGHTADAVADCVDAAIGGAQRGVDDDAGPVAANAGEVELKARDIRPAPVRDQEMRAVDLGVAVEDDARALAMALGPQDRPAFVQGNAVAEQGATEHPDRFGILVQQEPVSGDQGDLAAERAHRLCQLYRSGRATEHDQPLRTFRQLEDAVLGQAGQLGQARNVGQSRQRSGRDDEAPRLDHALADDDLAAILEACLALSTSTPRAARRSSESLTADLADTWSRWARTRP